MPPSTLSRLCRAALNFSCGTIAIVVADFSTGSSWRHFQCYTELRGRRTRQSVIGASGLLPLRVQLHELGAERVAAGEWHRRTTDREVERRERACFREMSLGGGVVAVPASVGGNPEMQTRSDLVVGEVADGLARVVGVIGTSPVRTQLRTVSRCGPASTPVNSLNMSELNATPLGRTIRSCSSIQITVGTLLMA